MTEISIPLDNPVYAFGADERPRAVARPGDKVRFQTSNATYANLTGRDIDRGRVNFQKANALYGPVFVEGARPGDALGVTIESIAVSDMAFAVYVARWRRSMFGLAESHVVEVEMRDNVALLPNGGRIAAKPMIGCIGVAPATGTLSSLSPTARTGGNMDLVELSAGATIWLPVEVEGARLSLGDLHVRMGRGEPVGSGLECGGEVVATLRIAAGRSMSGPFVCDSMRISFVGTGEDEPEAERSAVRAAWDWLTNACGVDLDTGLSICAALLDLNHGGPAGANVVAGFDISALNEAGVSTTVWPLA
jgi:amidase